MASGALLYDYPTLRAYAEADAQLFAQIKPDLVVADMRWSAPIVASAAQIPCAIIQNAYWHPAANLQGMPVPEYPHTRLAMRILGERWAHRAMQPMLPWAMRPYLAPLNRLRKDYHQPAMRNFLQAITTADHVFYADMPEICPVVPQAENEHYLGPILWQPSLPPPDWWDAIPTDRPIVYVALGSSGNAGLLPDIFNVLEQRPVTVVAAAPASFTDARVHRYAAPYFAYDEIACRASLLIGNGGSGFVYQTIKAGVPGVGIADNLDQLMSMSRAQSLKVGQMIRNSQASPARIGQAVDALLGNAEYRAAIAPLRQQLLQQNAAVQFVAEVERILRPAQSSNSAVPSVSLPPV